MEKLDFRFSRENFGDIPTMDFQGFQQKEENFRESPETKRDIFYKEEKYIQPTETLDFTLHANKENVSSENNAKTQSLQKVKSNLNLSKHPKKLIAAFPKNPKLSQKNKFKKPFQKQKRPNLSKIINKEWDDNVRTTGVFFEKVDAIGFNENKIKDRNKDQKEKKIDISKSKEQKERKKYKTYQTPQLLQESISKEGEQKKQFVKQVKFKKEKIKEIESLIENEQQKKNIIHEKFSSNLKSFQSQKATQSKSLPKKSSKIKFSPKPRSDNLLEIDNYTPPKQSFPKNNNFLNHETFQQQLQMKKENIKFANLRHETDVDEVPTRENGEPQKNDSSKKAKDLLGIHNSRPLKISSKDNGLVSQIEMNEKERLLEEMILKHKEEMIRKKGGFIPTEYTKQINKKIEQIKHDMEPFLNTLGKRTNQVSDYPFTHNLLANACSKLVCVNSEKITEMIVDDILIEMVDVLNENEEKENNQGELEKKNGLIDDFIDAMKDLQCDQDEILNKRNEFGISQNKIREIKADYLLKTENKNYYRIVEVSEKMADKILKDKLGLDSLLSGKSLNDKKTVNKMKDASEILINQIFLEVFDEFEKAQDEFVEKLYQQEFFQN